jgi:CBS domain-containing protein
MDPTKVNAEEFSEENLRAFMRRLLDDVHALEEMLDGNMIESGVRRIGAEQEMFLIDRNGGPAPVSVEVLERLNDPAFTTELARFNLEANAKPYRFGGSCLRRLEKEILELVDKARVAADQIDTDILLCGILPTLRQEDLSLDNMTPVPRYFALNEVLSWLRGGEFQTHIKGLDELQITHDNILLEACNTSFQIHFQVGPREFAKLYNVAQAVTGPVLAAAVNSPILLQRRLWAETRVALFQQSVDTRSNTLKKRGQRRRVSFGERWVDDSIIEIFREDIARLRVVLAAGEDEDPLAMVARGEAPPLTALRTYNGTVYRWNRPCYGVSARGKAHLRIENRVLPAGPTVLDEMANSAFYFGLMSAFIGHYGPIRKMMTFDDAKSNFIAAARHGLSANLNWEKGKEVRAADLILHELLPLAREGLEQKKIDPEDIDRYLGVIEERVKAERTGSAWAIRSWADADATGLRAEERQRRIAKAMLACQRTEEPVHTWDLCDMSGTDQDQKWDSLIYVGQSMVTDLITASPGDLVDLAASKMQWQHIRHLAVEDQEGRLVGLISYRDILKLVGRSSRVPVAVSELMTENVLTVTPTTTTLEALRLMRDRGVGCIPVVEDGRLVGMLTESIFLGESFSLIERELRQAQEASGIT